MPRPSRQWRDSPTHPSFPRLGPSVSYHRVGFAPALYLASKGAHCQRSDRPQWRSPCLHGIPGLVPLHFDLQTKVGYLRARRFPRFIFCGEQNNLSGSMQWQLYWALLSSYLQVNGSFMNGLELCLVRYCLWFAGPSLHLLWRPRTIA